MERDVTVQEVIDREYVGASESDGLVETAELMLAEESDCAVVLRGSEPVGVMTERDALSAFVEAERGASVSGSAGDESKSEAVDGSQVDLTVSDAMTETVPTVSPEMTIGEAADQLSATATKRLIVSDGTEPLGVVSERDLITTSPFAPAVGATVEAAGERAVAGVSNGRGEVTGGAEQPRGFDDQSICEACGGLARDLSPFNGQLLCGDCRDI